MINGLDSLARRSIVNDLRWFLFILNSVFIFFSRFCSFLHFVSFRFSCDLTFAVRFVCASEQSSWLFIHDQCQMQANELRLFKTERHRTDSTANFGIFSLDFIIFFFHLFFGTRFFKITRFSTGDESGWMQLETTQNCREFKLKTTFVVVAAYVAKRCRFLCVLPFVCAHCQASDPYHSW